MGLDLRYLRCPERIVISALTDLELARTLVYGNVRTLLAPGESVADAYADRQERAIVHAISGEHFLHSESYTTWIGRALAGDGWLHMGVLMNGYGSPRFLNAAEVRDVAAQFEALAAEAIDEGCRHAYTGLRELYLAAAHLHQAVVVIPE